MITSVFTNVTLTIVRLGGRGSGTPWLRPCVAYTREEVCPHRCSQGDHPPPN